MSSEHVLVEFICIKKSAKLMNIVGVMNSKLNFYYIFFYTSCAILCYCHTQIYICFQWKSLTLLDRILI